MATHIDWMEPPLLSLRYASEAGSVPVRTLPARFLRGMSHRGWFVFSAKNFPERPA